MTVPNWATAYLPHLAAAAAGAIIVALLLARTRRRTPRRPVAVLAAAIAAMGCTAYSADTSWRFAADHLDMNSTVERAAMFGAGEMALFSTALMARQNLQTTGAPGLPGILVWVITGVQIIPAYAESGLIGGTVRAFVGPILAAVLWHLAMGIELRHAKPGAGSQSLIAVLVRELRERLLSRFGLAVRDRTAEQITRDRATARAVRLAARPKLHGWGRRRLAAAVDQSQAGVHPEQRDMLLLLLAARRNAVALSSIALPSPWLPEPESGTRAEPVPARVVLVPVPPRRPQPVPVEAEPRPELQAVPEPPAGAELMTAPEPARHTHRRTVRKSAKGSAFTKHVSSARRWLAADPELSGAAIGKRLGTSDRYGRKVKDAALAS